MLKVTSPLSCVSQQRQTCLVAVVDSAHCSTRPRVVNRKVDDGQLTSLVVAVVIVAIVMQRNAVEAKEGISNFVARRRQAAVKRNTLQVARLLTTDIHTLTLLDVAEVERVNPTTGVGDNRRLHVSDQGPLRSAEEGVSLDIRSTCTST